MSEKSSNFLEIFRRMAEQLGIPQLYFDNENTCQLAFGDGLEVTLRLDPIADILTIYAVVADMEGVEDRSELLNSMMQGNYFWMATEGFTLSIAEDSLTVLLAGKQNVAYFDDENFLHEYLLTFADTVRKWAELCKAAEPWPATP